MDEIAVEFDRAVQGIGPLREAAYRLIDLASCIVEATDAHYVCRLLPKHVEGPPPVGDFVLKQRFIDLVTDENLREKVSIETSGVRDVILALAFGALAKEHDGSAA